MTTSKINNMWDSLTIEPLTIQDLNTLTETNSSPTISLSNDSPYSWSSDTITLGSTAGTITPTIGTISGVGGIYTTDSTTGTNGWTSPYIFNGNLASGSGQLQLSGKNADIVVNGRSLMDAIDKIEERLNMLKPNSELEKEWDQLRELGEQYRKLEAELKEKSKMWQTLKHMPPPEIP